MERAHRRSERMGCVASRTLLESEERDTRSDLREFELDRVLIREGLRFADAVAFREKRL